MHVAGEPAVPVIEIKNLVKQYGKIEALKGVSLSVEKGEIFGLLGQNGAGKTTMVKILLGITKPSFGDATLAGRDRPATRGIANASATCPRTTASPTTTAATACSTSMARSWTCPPRRRSSASRRCSIWSA